jgi:hypothetical protein
MKLIRFGNKGSEKPGIIDSDNNRRDASGLFKDWNKEFFETMDWHNWVLRTSHPCRWLMQEPVGRRLWQGQVKRFA